MIRANLIAVALLATTTGHANAATFVKADVTTLLGPSFFVDDAATGGTDATVNQPSSGSYVRSFSGLLTANQGSTTVTITGLGFATSTSVTNNDATSLTVTITYLGADGAAGGGDDVVIGSATGAYVYASSGEYGCVFDTPLTATLNITAVKFLVAIAPSNASSNGSVLFKVATIPFDGITGPKLSVAGTTSASLPIRARRLNVAKYQAVTASSENGNYIADYATDGIVGNENSWRTVTSTDPHTGEISLPVTISVRSAHLYLGVDDGLTPGNFKVQYFTGGSWVDAPGSFITGNTATEVNVIFTSAVTASRFRFYSDVDGSPRVKEMALFRTNPAPGTGTELGYPIGTDVELSVAKKRPAVASAVNGTNYAKLAVDGYVSTSSKWQTTTVGTNTLDIDLRVSTKIGSAHLYSGDGSIAPLSDFTLQYWNGTAWADISGGVITGNTSAARVIPFTTAPTTSQVRLTFNNPGTSAVRELCIFPANGGAGYALGQDVIGSAPPTQKFEDYNDGFYQVINRAAGLAMSVNGAAPTLDPGALDAELSQYQLLLNVGTNTYRLRNRSTGKCLAGATLTTTAGAALVDQNYTSMPHQNWRLVPVDGTDFYLVNDWSGLVVDTASAATTAGTGLVQQVMNGSTTQHWRFAFQTHYPKKGLAGALNKWSEFKGSWGYNWGRTTTTSLPTSVIFHPMQWGNFNWNTLEQLVPGWKREDKPLHVLGFNEPDGASQANITVADAITLWPRLERTDMPLASPVTVNPGNAWMDDFMTQAQSLGYRTDVIATHKYPGPNSGDPSALISELQGQYNAWGRPVWLTEFSTVDWAGTSTWTEEDNYNWLAEFMWRAESLTWLRHYSLFLFSGAEETNPWDPTGPRSNAYKADGTTPTAFGELYFAWDGDATVRGDKAYFLHNKAERKRLQNAVSSTGPSEQWIREGTNLTQWVLRPSPTAGQYYITSLRDGRRLRYTGSALNFAPAHTTGTAVQWSLVEDQYGWFYIENPAAAASTRRLRDLAGSFSMVSNTSTGDNVKWRFIVPYAPVETNAPDTLTGLAPTAGDTQVTLNWTASTNTDFSFYKVYRSTTPGGPFTLVSGNLTTTSFTNTALTNGTVYYYTITATDLTGYESIQSTAATATPVIATLPPTSSFTVATPTPSNFTITWPSTHLGWILESQTGSLSANGWTAVPNSTITTSYAAPITPSTPATFFRLRKP
ncbi:MAG: RICIN domain-containing protein [Verrucomicrobiaceae bacterium]|nr:RICIN domain-containing protein [Verrucomicrobiaceae bacterium]